MTKIGRPFNGYARAHVLRVIILNPGIRFHQLWKAVRESGVSKGTFCTCLRELEAAGRIRREVRERVVASVSFTVANVNDLGTKPRSSIAEGNPSYENGGGAGK